MTTLCASIIVDILVIGATCFENPSTTSETVTNFSDRLQLLTRLLDSEDYRFIETRNPAIAKRFRHQRMRIVRIGLREIAGELGSTFRKRASRIEAAGRWRAYPALAGGTALTFCAIAKLRLACTLFAWRLPVPIDVAAAAKQVSGFATAGELSIAPAHLRA